MIATETFEWRPMANPIVSPHVDRYGCSHAQTPSEELAAEDGLLVRKAIHEIRREALGHPNDQREPFGRHFDIAIDGVRPLSYEEPRIR